MGVDVTTGRCCGRKPILYKGGSWRSPRGAPLLFCCKCDGEFDPDPPYAQRENFAWKKDATGQFLPKSRPVMNPPADEAEAGNREHAAPPQADSDAACRGKLGLTSEPEARPVTPTARSE